MKKVTILMSDRFATRFMQHADVFEDFKVVIQSPLEATVIDDYGEKNIQALLKQCEDAPYAVVAVYDHEKVYYRDPKVKVISTGEAWVPLDDLLPKNQQAYQGTKGETNEQAGQPAERREAEPFRGRKGRTKPRGRL